MWNSSCPPTPKGPLKLQYLCNEVIYQNKGVLFSHNTLELLPSILRTSLTKHEQYMRKYYMEIQFYEQNKQNNYKHNNYLCSVRYTVTVDSKHTAFCIPIGDSIELYTKYNILSISVAIPPDAKWKYGLLSTIKIALMDKNGINKDHSLTIIVVLKI